MKVKRRRSQYKYLIITILLISLLTSIFFVVYQFLLKNGGLISPVPIALSSRGQKIFLSNISGNKLETLLSKNNISYSSIVFLPDSSFLIKLTTGEEVILSSKKDLNSQVSSLQLILNRLKIEGKRFVRLDLRFDKPVITFENL